MSVTARLADRDHALFPQPMPIDWSVVDAAADAAQPVNADVLIDVAKLVAQRARASALNANRRGDLKGAAHILTAAAADLRALAPGIREVEALAAELEAQRVIYAEIMSPLALKAEHVTTYYQSSARDARGRARKGSRAS